MERVEREGSIMADSYVCASCKGEFIKAWSDVASESVDMEIVCDDCYKKIMGEVDV